MRSSFILLALVALLLATVAGCMRAGNDGEVCSNPGISESQYNSGFAAGCAAGLICAPDHATSATYSQFDRASCRRVCASDRDCATGSTCRGVTGAEFRSACLPIAN